MGMITEIERYSVYDGPGIRTTVFLKGCPLRCYWCSSPETWIEAPQIYYKADLCKNGGACVSVCSINAISMEKTRKIDRERCNVCMKCVDVCNSNALCIVGKETTAEYIVKEIEKDAVFYKRSGGGATISGGEPLFQPGFTSQILELCHKKRIHTALDTSGYGNSSDLKKILENTDLVLLDLKHMDKEMHKRCTGVSNDVILRNARVMSKFSEVRISLPLIRRINDSLENIKKTAEFTLSLGAEYIDIEPLHKFGKNKYTMLGMQDPYSTLSAPTQEELDGIVKVIHSYGLETTMERKIK